MSPRSFIQRLISILFVTALFLPLLVYIIQPVQDVSLSEKRKLASFPAIHVNTTSLKVLTTELEKYWNDHFGLRDFFISTNSRLQTGLFNRSPVKTVIQGKENWLFFNLKHVVRDFLGMTPASPELLEYWSKTIALRKEWLAKYNIKYIVMPVPSKMNVYPEFLPIGYNLFRQWGEETSLDQLFSLLETKDNSQGVVHLKPPFMEMKVEDKLFYRTDTHWTYEGAYLAYLQIIEHLQYWYPDMQPISKDLLRYDKKRHKGDLTTMLGLKETSEESVRLSVRTPCTTEFEKIENHDSSKTRRHPVVSFCAGKQLTAVVVHDSYGPYLRPFLSEHFAKVTYVSMKDFNWLIEFLPIEKPDVFIHEQAARQIDGMFYESWNLVGEKP